MPFTGPQGQGPFESHSDCVASMEDEEGTDDKIIAVPHDKLHPFWEGTQTWRDLPQILLDQIKHFFSHYKDLEEGKWVKVSEWSDIDVAEKLIMESIETYKREG